MSIGITDEAHVRVLSERKLCNTRLYFIKFLAKCRRAGRFQLGKCMLTHAKYALKEHDLYAMVSKSDKRHRMHSLPLSHPSSPPSKVVYSSMSNLNPSRQYTRPN